MVALYLFLFVLSTRVKAESIVSDEMLRNLCIKGGAGTLASDIDMTKKLTDVNEPLQCLKSLSLDGSNGGGGAYTLSFTEPKNPYFDGGFMVFGAVGSKQSFSLSNLHFSASSSTKSALQIKGGKMIIEKSRFTGNDSRSSGGALSVMAGVSDVVTLRDTSFENNTSGGMGGAIVMGDYKNELSIQSLTRDVKFQNNRHLVELDNIGGEANAIMMNSSSLSLDAASGRVIEFYDGIIGSGDLLKGDVFDKKGASRILINGGNLASPSSGVVRFEKTAQICNAYIKLRAGTLSLAEESCFYVVSNESSTLRNNVLSLQGGVLDIANQSLGILRTSTLELFDCSLISMDAGDKFVTNTLSVREGAVVTLSFTDWTFDDSVIASGLSIMSWGTPTFLTGEASKYFVLDAATLAKGYSLSFDDAMKNLILKGSVDVSPVYLVDFWASSDPVFSVFTLRADEVLSRSMGKMGGVSFSIEGDGYAVNGALFGGMLVEETQSLVIRNVGRGGIAGFDSDGFHCFSETVITVSSMTQGLSLLIENTVFKENRTEGNGAAVNLLGGTAKFVDTSFLQNEAQHLGGAVFIDGGAYLSVVAQDSNVLFSGNKADGVANGIHLEQGSLALEVKAGRTIVFDDGISSYDVRNKLSINELGGYGVVEFRRGAMISQTEIKVHQGSLKLEDERCFSETKKNSLILAGGVLDIANGLAGALHVTSMEWGRSSTIRLDLGDSILSSGALLLNGGDYKFELQGDLESRDYTLIRYLSSGSSIVNLSHFSLISDSLDLTHYELSSLDHGDGFMSLVLRYTYVDLTDEITLSLGGETMNKGTIWDSVVEDLAGISDPWSLTVREGGSLISRGDWGIQFGIVLLDSGHWNAEGVLVQGSSQISVQSGGTWVSFGDVVLNGGSVGEEKLDLSVSGKGSSWTSKGGVRIGLGGDKVILDILQGALWTSEGSVMIGESALLNIHKDSTWRVSGDLSALAVIDNRGDIIVSGLFSSSLSGDGSLFVQRTGSVELLGSSYVGTLSNQGRVSIGASGVTAHLAMSGMLSGRGDVRLYQGSTWTLMVHAILPHTVGNMKQDGELLFDLGKSSWASGTYTLLSYMQFSGAGELSIAGIVYNGLSRVNYVLSNNTLAHEIQLHVNGDAATLTWSQGLNGDWDLLGREWSYDHALTKDGRFFQQDHVVFQTKDAQVRLCGSLQAGSITVLEDVKFSGGSLQTSKLMLANKLGITSLQGVYQLGAIDNIHNGVLELGDGVRVAAQSISGKLGIFLDKGATLRLSGLASCGELRNEGTLVFDLGNRLWAHGVYTLATYGVYLGDGEMQLEGFVLSEDSRVNYFLENKKDEHKVELTVNGAAARLVWNQGARGIWDVRGEGWAHEVQVLDGRFYHNDYVVFNTVGAEIEIRGEVKPGGMIVSESMLFTGESLDCVGTLLKQGEGKVVFDNQVTRLRNLDLQEGQLEVSGQLFVYGGATLSEGSVLSLVGGGQHELREVRGTGARLAIGAEAEVSFLGSNVLGNLVGNKVEVKSGNTLVRQLNLDSVDVFEGATLSLEGAVHAVGVLSGHGSLSLNGDNTSLVIGEATAAEAMLVQLGNGTELKLGGASSLGDLAGTGKLVFSGETLQLKSIGSACLQVEKGVVHAAQVQGAQVILGEGSRLTTGYSSSLSGIDGRGTWVIEKGAEGILWGDSSVHHIIGDSFILESGVELKVAELSVNHLINRGTLLLDLSSAQTGSTLLNVDSYSGLGESLTIYTGEGAHSVLGILGKSATVAILGGETYTGSLFFAGMELTDNEGEQLYDRDGTQFNYTYHDGVLSIAYYIVREKPGSTPRTEWFEDGSSITYTELESMSKGELSLADNTLMTTLSVAGDRPDQAGTDHTFSLGTGVKSDNLGALSIISSSMYIKEDLRDPDDNKTDTSYNKQGETLSLYLSGTVKLEAEENETAYIGAQEGTENTAIDSIQIANDSRLELHHTNIVLSAPSIPVESLIDRSKVDLYDASLVGGSLEQKIVFNESYVQGTGSLKNIVFHGGAIHAGHSPGVLSLENADLQGGVRLELSVSSKGLSYTGMNDNTVETLSQFQVVGRLDVSDALLKIVFDVDVDVSAFGNGVSFKFFELSSGVIVGDFAQMIMPELPVGKRWDFNAATGMMTIRYERIADGVSFANTLWTSGNALESFATEARQQMITVNPEKMTMWMSSINDFAQVKSQGEAVGYDYDAQGYAVGTLNTLESGDVFGIAFASSYGKNTPRRRSDEERSSKIRQESMMLALYGKIQVQQSNVSQGRWSLDFSLAYGDVENDSQRYVKTQQKATCAQWSDSICNIHTQVNYLQSIQDKTSLNAFIGLDFVRGRQDDIAETVGSGVQYTNGAYHNLRADLGIAVYHTREFSNGQALISSLQMSYGYDVFRMDTHTDVQEPAGMYRDYGVEMSKTSFSLTPSLSFKMSPVWSFRTYYNLRMREGMTEQNVNASVSYEF